LYLSKNNNIEGLELVGAFGGESEDKDVMLVRGCVELIGFVRIVAIEEEDGVVVQLVGGGKWDEGLSKPLEAKFVVGPPIGRCGDCADWNTQFGKCWDGSLCQNEHRGVDKPAGEMHSMIVTSSRLSERMR